MSDESSAAPRPLGEISQEPSALDQFMEKNQKLLIGVVAFAAVAACGLIIQRGMKRGEETTAGSALSKAEDAAALQKIVKDHGGTTAGGSAKLLLAEKQWSEGQQDASITTLKEFISSDPEHAAIPSAEASLGSKLASQGKIEEATAVFTKLSESDEGKYLAPFALLSLGDLTASAGDTAKAESYYQKARDGYPDSSFGNTAIRRLEIMKAKAPVEIEPPPAPPAAPENPANPSIPGLPGTVPDTSGGIPGLSVPVVPVVPDAPPAPAPAEPAPKP